MQRQHDRGGAAKSRSATAATCGGGSGASILGLPSSLSCEAAAAKTQPAEVFPEYKCANPQCTAVLNPDGLPVSLIECRHCAGRIFTKSVASRAIRYSTR